MLFNNGILDMSFQRNGVISAYKASTSATNDTTKTLKHTVNPRLGARENDTNEKKSYPEYVKSSINHEDYTPDGIEKKVQERLFSTKTLGTQSSDQRARLLNSMYSDLLSESYKRDPYLREEHADACDAVTSSVQVVRHNEC